MTRPEPAGDAGDRAPAPAGRKLTPADRLDLIRALAAGDARRSDLARRYGISRPYVTQFAQENARQIDAVRRDLDNEFAGLWIADKAKRIAAYEADHDLSAGGDYAAHYEQVRTRAQILRNVAEELGQLPRGNTAVIVPVVHVIEGIDTAQLT